MISLPYICHSTTIYQLMQAGIVPDWMYRDCDTHGMDTAEDFLCEWDWDWNWDLGKGYSNKRLEILAKARQIVREGIEEFQRNPELQKMEQERVDKIRKRKELSVTLQKKFCPPFYVAEIPHIVNYVLEHDEEPVFMIFYWWFNRHRHSDRNKVRFVMSGIYDGKVRSPKEMVEMTQSGELKEKFGIETEFTLRQLQRLAKTPYEMKGKLNYIIPAIRTKLQEYSKGYSDLSLTLDSSLLLPSPDHQVWRDISERENARFNTALLSQALRYFLQA